MQVEHFSKRFPGMTIEDGYAVSRAWVARKIADGRQVRGHKIGLTSRAMQQASQIDEPDYGTLLDDMFFEPGDIPSRRFIAPRVEVELAFILKRKLEGTKITVDDVLDATDYVTPAIEIIDARIEQFDRHTKAMRKVLRHDQRQRRQRRHRAGRPARCSPREVDLPWCGAILRQNGAVEETGLAAGVQGHPAVGVAWLAMQARALGRMPARPARSCWPARSRGPSAPRPATASTPTTARWAASNSTSPETRSKPERTHADPDQPVQEGHGRQAHRRYGLWVSLMGPLSTEICAAAGFDWLLLDGEHSPNDPLSLLQQSQIIAGYPATHAIARVPMGHGYVGQALIKQYLDVGIQTLLVPMVDTPEQARELVRCMRYPPDGIRGMAGHARLAAGAATPTTRRKPTTRSACWCRWRRAKAWATSTRSPPSRAWTACSSARRTCRPRSATSATRWHPGDAGR